MKEVAVLSSALDPASANIAGRLMELRDWERHEGYSSYRNFRLVILEERLIAARDLDARLRDMGLSPDLVVFASRHEAKSGVPWLGGHFTGVIDDGMVATAAPSALRSFLWGLVPGTPEGFGVSAEATHHGPTDIRTPSFFAEIGSTKSQWTDPDAGTAVASSILGLETRDLPTFLGFGGGHYVHRQTKLMMETGIAFGHLFSNYQVDSLDLSMVDLALKRSGAEYAYLDRGSLRSSQKKMLSLILEELEVPVLREKEIRARFPADGGV